MHPVEGNSSLNQWMLMNYYCNLYDIGNNYNPLIGQFKSFNKVLEFNAFTASALDRNFVGSKVTLRWQNVHAPAGPIYAVVYNLRDGAYMFPGTVDANGTAVFNNFILNDASTVTMYTAP